MEANNARWEEFNSIVDTLDLDVKEKGLLLILFRYVNYKTGYSNPSRVLIKSLTGISDNRTLDKIFNSLINKGFLERESGQGIRSKYFIKVGVKNAPSEIVPPSGEITPTVGGEITPTVGGEITPQKEKDRKTKENNILYINLSFIDDVIDNVKITQEQYDKLINKFGSSVVNKTILDLDNYISNGKGAKYKDHYRALNNWCSKEKKECNYNSKNKNQQFNSKYNSDSYID